MAAHVNMVNLSMISCLSTLIFEKILEITFVETSIIVVFSLCQKDSKIPKKTTCYSKIYKFISNRRRRKVFLVEIEPRQKKVYLISLNKNNMNIRAPFWFCFFEKRKI